MRVAAAAVPLLSACMVGLSGACGSGHVPQAEPADATTASAVNDSSPFPAYDGLPAEDAGQRTPVHAEFLSTRVDTEQLMFAAGEMQTSGEPFAENFGGRNLAYYDRYYIPVDQYLVPSTTGRFFDGYTDLFGFSSAVESYEYSKYHVNMIAHQTGAGVSLANGPLLASDAGATPRDRLRTRVEHLLYAAGTDVSGYAHFDGGAPAGSNALNDFGFPGLWPSMVPYADFDPTMQPDTTITHSCTTATGYGGVIFFGSSPVFNYECAYNSLNLGYSADAGYSAAARAAQIDPVIGPGTLGFATWKYALWGIDFTGRLHDSIANSVTAVAPEDMARVGTQGNTVQAVQPPNAAPGVFVGSTPLEGMWGLLFLDEADNAASWLLSSLATTDGSTLGGFSSVAQAIQYDYTSPLVWFPAAIAVTEDSTTPYPGVASLAIKDATSQAVDLAALAQGYALLFGMTDARNAAVGQQIGCQIEFSGSVFPADDGLPDGEDTPSRSRARGDARCVRRSRPDARRSSHTDRGRHRHGECGRAGTRFERLDDDTRARGHRSAPPPHGLQRGRLAVRRAGPQPRRRRAGHPQHGAHPPGGSAGPESADVQRARASGRHEPGDFRPRRALDSGRHRHERSDSLERGVVHDVGRGQC